MATSSAAVTATKGPKLKVLPFDPHGNLGKRWEKWFERFERDLKYNGCDPSKTTEIAKMALLIYAGTEVEDLHDTLPEPGKPEGTEEENWTAYEQSKTKLKLHFSPKQCNDFAIFELLRMKIESSESITSYAMSYTRKGHYASKCFKKQKEAGIKRIEAEPQTDTRNDTNSDTDEYDTAKIELVNNLGMREKPSLMRVRTNDQEALWQPDTGTQKDAVLTAGDRTVDTEIYVTSEPSAYPLLSEQSAKQLQLIRYNEKFLVKRVSEPCKKVLAMTRRQKIADMIMDNPEVFTDRAESKIQDLLDQDIIERFPDNQPRSWVSPPLIAPKPDSNDIRFCIDMRMANKATQRPYTQIPTTADIVNKFQGAERFTKLDLKEAYHQFVFDEQSRNITTFYGPDGLYRYKRLNFGTKSAQDILQLEMHKMLSGIPS
ncbi:Hypothetical predicted protein [Paramuricea clavata]|uniref:Uncharacterized protein n=1 Tax=Paramuricea clavata TaxID=317549 RepID=A0A7D9L301_PARCT|nr:Hypothetical predicted protein [Paramuricea clavata]